MHEQFSGVKGSLCKVSMSSVCTAAVLNPAVAAENEEEDIGNGVLQEKVDKCCYLEDMLDADEEYHSTVTS